MSSFLFDLRQTMRLIRRRPSFPLIAGATLAVGFAAHFSAFGIVDRLLLSPPAQVADADRVFRVHVNRADSDGGRFLWYQTPYRSYQDLRAMPGPFTSMAAYRWTQTSVGTGADARQIRVNYTDEHYFPLFGVSAQMGRVFGAEENRPPAGTPVLVLSDGYWRSAFGGDRAAIGKTVRIGTQAFTIVGVMPRAFAGDATDPIDAWAPLHTLSAELPPTWTTSYLSRSVMMLGRLAPETDARAAAEHAAQTYRRSVEGTPAADATARVVLATLLPGRTQQGTLTDQARIALWLEALSVLVLLVAVANVVNLQMSRAAAERRDLALRVAIGAGRGRLVRALMIEMLIVSAAAMAGGALLTWLGAGSLHRLLLPGATGLVLTWRLGLIGAATLVLTTTLVVAFAAMQVRTDDVAERLRSGRGSEGFSGARLREGLLVAQVVMSALLLVCAGLFLRSIRNLDRLQYGIDPDRVIAINIPLRAAGFTDADAERFYERALAEVAAVPGIDGVSATHSTPFAPSQRVELFLPGPTRLPLEAGNYPTFYTTTPGYFRTMGMTILRGHGFNDADVSGAPPVIVVEAALADALWPGDDPLSKCLVLVAADRPCRQVVGVASNTRRFVNTSTGALRYYVPMGQRVVQAPPQAMLVSGRTDPVALIPAVRAALLRAADRIPYAQIRVLRDLTEPETRSWRLGSTLFVIFGAAALFVATAGVYALLSFSVAQRWREIGVRLALGASPSSTRKMVFTASLRYVALGLVIGLTIALSCGRFLEPTLFETRAIDPIVFAATAVLLMALAVGASVVPAIRAGRVDPNRALRAD